MALTKLNNQSIAALTDFNLSTDDLPSGTVLQVVQAKKTDTQSSATSGTTPVVIGGLSCTITPSSASSKILVTVNIGFLSSNTGNHQSLAIHRNGTMISEATGDAASIRPRRTFGLGHNSGADWEGAALSFSYLDSPATTSSLTYTVYYGGNGSSVMHINRAARDNNNTNEDGRYLSTIIAQEIAG